jgi:hypothetical protein
MEQVTVMPICLSQFLGGKTSGALPYPKPSPDPEEASDRTATQGNPGGQHPTDTQINLLALPSAHSTAIWGLN